MQWKIILLIVLIAALSQVDQVESRGWFRKLWRHIRRALGGIRIQITYYPGWKWRSLDKFSRASQNESISNSKCWLVRNWDWIQNPSPGTVLANIQNYTMTANENDLRGIFSIGNAVIQASKYSPNYAFNSKENLLEFRASLQNVKFSGNYGIAKGFINDDSIGEHTFSGRGGFSISPSPVNYIHAVLNVDEKQSILKDFRIKTNIKEAKVFMETFVVDGKLVNWENVGEEQLTQLASVFDDLTEGMKEYIQELIQGCTISDLKQVLK